MEWNFFSLFVEWLVAVVHHWEVIVVTGAIPFGIELLDRVWEKKMPKRHYTIFVAVGLFLATYAAWREEREKVQAEITYVNISSEQFHPPDYVPVFNTQYLPQVNLGYSNLGAYIANKVQRFVSLESYDVPATPAFQITPAVEEIVFDKMRKRASAGPLPSGSLPPSAPGQLFNGNIWFTAFYDHMLTQSEVDDFRTVKKVMFVVGFVKWEDGAGKHEWRYCNTIKPPADAQPVILVGCSSHNEFLPIAQD